MVLAATYSPPPSQRSTIGADRLNFRVRNGIGCTPVARTTKTMISKEVRSFLLSTEKRKEKKVCRYISTSRLNPSQGFHLKPINLVISEDILPHVAHNPQGIQLCSLETLCYVRRLPYLELGFPLICFQRLSFPNVATEQCSWRNSSYTRGLFFPVLSY